MTHTFREASWRRRHVSRLLKDQLPQIQVKERYTFPVEANMFGDFHVEGIPCGPSHCLRREVGEGLERQDAVE